MKYDLHFDAPLEPETLSAAVAGVLGVSRDDVVVVDPKKLPDRPAIVYCLVRQGEVSTRVEIFSHADDPPPEKVLAEALRLALGLDSPGSGDGDDDDEPDTVDVELDASDRDASAPAPAAGRTGARSFSRLVFEGGSDERASLEAPLLGYCRGVWVELDDGSRHPVTFYDLARLGRDLDDALGTGRPFIGEPGLVVVPKVTLANMEAAAKALAEEGFFGG